MSYQFADETIKSILQAYRLSSLHASDDTIYALKPDLTIAYTNLGWSKFASENGGCATILKNWPLGSSIANSIPPELRQFYASHFSECLKTGSPWQHVYDCSSPDRRREFVMTAYPLGDRAGFLVVNSARQDDMTDSSPESDVSKYRNSDGLIMQCVHCRRISRKNATAVWDCVPAWLSKYHPDTSHGICEACFGFFYPDGLPIPGGYPKMLRTDHRTLK